MKAGTSPTYQDFLRSGAGKFVVFLLVALAAYECAQLIADDDLETLLYGGLLILGMVGLIALIKDWKKGVYCFVAWIMFEDLVRKYLGNNMAIYFFKDFLVLALYVSFFMARRYTSAKLYKPPFLTAFVVFFWFCLVQALNPASTSIFFGLMGLKLDFLYAPLVLLGYALIESPKDVRRFFFFNSILILMISGFGIVQAILGHTFLNPEVMQEDIRALSSTYRVSPITGLIAYRPTSFFVSAGRFQDFMIVSWTLALGFGGFLLMRKQRGRFLGFTTVGLVGAASLMTASRGVFVWALGIGAAMIPASIWGAALNAERRIRVIRAIQRAAVFLAVALAILVVAFPEQLSSRLAIYSETLSPYSPKSELGYRALTYPLGNFAAAFDFPRWPYGYGTGTASLGGQYVTRLFHAEPMRIGVESGYGQLVLELGIVGLLLWIIMSYSIARSAWLAAKRLRGTVWFPLAFSIFLYAFVLVFPLSFYGFVAYQDFVMNAYLWLTLGILFKLAEFRNVSDAS
jgi:hypothetical protein